MVSFARLFQLSTITLSSRRREEFPSNEQLGSHSNATASFLATRCLFPPSSSFGPPQSWPTNPFVCGATKPSQENQELGQVEDVTLAELSGATATQAELQLPVLSTNESYDQWMKENERDSVLGQFLVATDSFAVTAPPDLGAEETIPAADCVEGEKTFTTLTSRTDYSRRISYEEMIHAEDDSDEVQTSEVSYSSALALADGSLAACLTVLTEWGLTLQNILGERENKNEDDEDFLSCPYAAATSTKCLCAKAEFVVGELKALERRYLDAIAVTDGLLTSIGPDLIDTAVRDISAALKRIQGHFRSHISIRASLVTSADRDRAAVLVSNVCDVRAYVRDATNTLIQLVNDLLGVTSCRCQTDLVFRMKHRKPFGQVSDSEDADSADSDEEDEDVVKPRELTPEEEEAIRVKVASMLGQSGNRNSVPGKAWAACSEDEDMTSEESDDGEDDEKDSESDDDYDKENSNRFTNNFANSNHFAAATKDSAATISVRRVTRKRKTSKVPPGATASSTSNPSTQAPNPVLKDPQHSPTSPTSSPRKRARKFRASSAPCGGYDASAMILLEKNRKGPRAHGLYQFVLWREALKAEKERVAGSVPPTPFRKPKMNLTSDPSAHSGGGKRLDFD